MHQVALLKEVGYDEAFNYKTTDTAEALKAAAPDGIDIYFEVRGPTMAGCGEGQHSKIVHHHATLALAFFS